MSFNLRIIKSNLNLENEKEFSDLVITYEDVKNKAFERYAELMLVIEEDFNNCE